MLIRKLRLQRGWSQEQLAELCDLSVRTIQRLEKGDSAGVETYKSLASIFEVNLLELRQQQERSMNKQLNISNDEHRVIEQVKKIKGFYSHVVSFVMVITALTLLNASMEVDYWWVLWVIVGWGIGLATHAAEVFDLLPWLGPDWEKREIEKRLGRKL
jgi:transcriptional regulator with XRE-family HTH domain